MAVAGLEHAIRVWAPFDLGSPLQALSSAPPATAEWMSRTRYTVHTVHSEGVDGANRGSNRDLQHPTMHDGARGSLAKRWLNHEADRTPDGGAVEHDDEYDAVRDETTPLCRAVCTPTAKRSPLELMEGLAMVLNRHLQDDREDAHSTDALQAHVPWDVAMAMSTGPTLPRNAPGAQGRGFYDASLNPVFSMLAQETWGGSTRNPKWSNAFYEAT